MTVIELLDRSPLVNIMATLAAKPDKLILLTRGDAADATAPYRAFFKAKGYPTAVTQRALPTTLAKATDALCAIVKEEGDCVIDVAGGDDTLLLAVGAAHERLQATQALSLWRADVQRGLLHRLAEGDTVAVPTALLTIRDLITLHGGSIRGATALSADTDREDIAALWRIARQDNTAWNNRLMFLNELEKRAQIDENRLDVSLNLAFLRGNVSRFDHKEAEIRALLSALQEYGLITDCHDGKHLRYTYKNRAVRKVLSGAGNILEMLVLSLTSYLTQDGQPFFHDCLMGVTIDWDGNGPARTNNEIDVMAMHGMIPLFISCKNGQVAEAEMYKLSAVAARFGGGVARKMLIVTDLAENKRFAARERAASLGIYLVDNAEALGRTAFREHLVKATT